MIVPPRPALVFLLSMVATMLSAMSGGSSSLLTTPAWIALGYPLPAAVASDKLAGALWTLVGARNYLRHRSVDWRLVGAMMVIGTGAAYLGTRITSDLDPARLTPIIGALILGAVALLAFRPTIATEARPPRLSRPATAAVALPLGFYEGMFGSGNSIAATLLFAVGRGYDFLQALGHYYLLAAVWCAAAAISYWSGGFFEPALALPATAGAVVGGYLGSRLGHRFGVRVVRGIFLVAGTALGGKLLLGW